MFARLLAIGGLLLLVFVPVGRPASRVSPGTPVGLYLKSHQDLDRPAIGYMQSELTSVLALAGLDVHWVNSEQAQEVQGRLLTVELRGKCKPVWSSVGVYKDHSALAASEVVDGKVLPYSWIDCSALNQLLAPSLPRDSDLEREKVYGRALSRLLAHEVYHMLAQTQKHTRHGLSKAQFTVADLLAERLMFEASAEAKLRPPAPPSAQVAGIEVGKNRPEPFGIE